MQESVLAREPHSTDSDAGDDRVKVPARNLGLQIVASFLKTGKRGADPRLNGFSGFHIKEDVGAGRAFDPLLLQSALLTHLPTPHSANMKGMIETNDGVAVEAGQFSLPGIEAAYRRRDQNLAPRWIDADLTIPDGGVSLHQNPGLASTVEAKAHQPGPQSAGHFGINVVVLQVYRITVRGAGLCGAIKGRRALHLFHFHLAAQGHQRHAAVVLGAGTAEEVATPKALNARVRIVVWRHALHIARAGLRRPLRHGKGQPGGGKCLSLIGGPNGFIDRVQW